MSLRIQREEVKIKDFIQTILTLFIVISIPAFVGGLASSKRQCSTNPTRIAYYSGLSVAYQIGCYMGKRID